MKIRLLLASLTLALAPLFSFAADSSPSELDDLMEQMNTPFRKLNRQITNASKNADSLAAVATMRERALEAMKLEPKRKAEVPAAEQAKFVADYQAGMKALVGQLDKLKAALEAGKNDEAAEILKSLKQSQEDGHKQFKKAKKK
jgi:soluble cytochrome b562